MEDSPYSALKNTLSSISVKALNVSSRLILASNLDIKQLIPSEKGFARDYRGLAELIGFQYHVIKKFEEFEDRTMKILESWETRPDATLDRLISYLEDMDRHDVIQDLIPLLKKNVENYVEYQKSLESPIQVAEVTPGPLNVCSRNQIFTRHDKISGECTIYDAYVSYADEDIDIVAKFANYLESPGVGLKLFIRGRDMLAGCPELDTDIELIKNRCRHMLILLTPNFIKSPALEFQVSFAGSLAIEQKQRILIPVILAHCEIPPILSSVSKIDFTKDHTQNWMWDKLVTSLLPQGNMSLFLSSLARSPIQNRNACNSACSVTADNRPVITFPQSAQHSICYANNSSSALAISPAEYNDNKDSGACSEMKDAVTCSEMKDSVACVEMKDSSACIEMKDSIAFSEMKDSVTSSPKTSSRKFSMFSSILKKKGNSSSASSTSFSSGATSGFHSQSTSNVKSLEISKSSLDDA